MLDYIMQSVSLQWRWQALSGKHTPNMHDTNDELK